MLEQIAAVFNLEKNSSDPMFSLAHVTKPAHVLTMYYFNKLQIVFKHNLAPLLSMVFNRVLRLLNQLPSVNLSLSSKFMIKTKIYKFCGHLKESTLIRMILVCFTFFYCSFKSG